MKRSREFLNRFLPKTPGEGAEWFVHMVTVIIAVWLSIRGGMIVVFQQHYLSDPGFLLLNAFPYAPASWGWTILGLGGLVLASVLYSQKRILEVSTLAAATSCTIIGSVVAASFYSGNVSSSYVSLSWFGMGALFLARFVASSRWRI